MDDNFLHVWHHIHGHITKGWQTRWHGHWASYFSALVFHLQYGLLPSFLLLAYPIRFQNRPYFCHVTSHRNFLRRVFSGCKFAFFFMPSSCIIFGLVILIFRSCFLEWMSLKFFRISFKHFLLESLSVVTADSCFSKCIIRSYSFFITTRRPYTISHWLPKYLDAPDSTWRNEPSRLNCSSFKVANQFSVWFSSGTCYGKDQLVKYLLFGFVISERSPLKQVCDHSHRSFLSEVKILLFENFYPIFASSCSTLHGLYIHSKRWPSLAYRLQVSSFFWSFRSRSTLLFFFRNTPTIFSRMSSTIALLWLRFLYGCCLYLRSWHIFYLFWINMVWNNVCVV